jgi:hypothetical protein
VKKALKMNTGVRKTFMYMLGDMAALIPHQKYQSK